MAAKKDKSGIESLRAEIQALTDSFGTFKDAMLTDAAVRQAEQQKIDAGLTATGDFSSVTEPDLTAAASLMAAIGHPQRLRMVLLLAQEPTSITTLVEQLGLKTSGAAYHHMNVLTNNGIAIQPQRGTFALAEGYASQIHRVLGALFGIDLDDTSKTSKKKKSK